MAKPASDGVGRAIEEKPLLELLGRLVACDTSNPPGRQYREFCELAAGELRALGLEVEIVPVPAEAAARVADVAPGFPRYNVVARWRTGGARTLHFNAHYDVVPAAAAGWSRAPFEFTREGAWVYGRGTADMKGAIASLLAAIGAVRRSGVVPPCTIEVSLVCDEETGSELGAAHLVRTGLVKPDYAVVCEGASGPRVCLGHNGTLWYEVTVQGKSAHASTPEKGVNAFERMCALGLALQGYGGRIRRRSYAAPDGYVLRPTVSVGGVHGSGDGAKINTVPAEAVFTIDRRVIPGEDSVAADRELREFLVAQRRRIPGLKYRLRKLEHNPSCLVDGAGELPQAMLAAVSVERRNRPRFTVSTGFNDMHWFALDARIPVVGYGPGGERYHANDERARVKDLVETAAVYARLMATFAG